MYLTAQHLRLNEGQQPNWELTGLQALIAEIHEANGKVADRIRKATEKDAIVNSLVFLDAQTLSLDLQIKSSMKKLKGLFKAYLEDPDPGKH